MMPDVSEFRAPDPGEAAHESWVFVSHTADDEPLLRSVLEPAAAERHLQLHLVNRRHAPTIAEAYRKEILRSLARCAWFLAAFTPGSIRSEWVRFEVSWALDHKPGDRVLLAILEACDPGLVDARLPGRHLVSCTGLAGSGIRRWLSRRRLQQLLPKGGLQ
jgi:hypothetical protein